MILILQEREKNGILEITISSFEEQSFKTGNIYFIN